MTVSIGLSYEGGLPPDALSDIAAVADGTGIGTFWAACHLFQRDPVVNAAMVLSRTRDLRGALMAMSPYTVHPVYATMAAAALDDWFPGRVTLSFGTGAPRDLEAVGLRADRPLGAIADSIAIARALLSGDPVTFRGERFQAVGRRLSSGRRDIPIILAASGPKMLELAGAAADGVLISAATSPAFVAWALDHVRRGEARAGRTVHKAALVYGSVAADGREARSRLRRSLAFILRGEHHARNLDLAGTRLDQGALTAAFAAEDWEAVEALVTDEVVANHTASGTPDELRAAVAAYAAAGLDEVVLSGIAGGDELRTLMRALRPAG